MNRMHVFRGAALGFALSFGTSTRAAAVPLQRADTTVITGRVTSEGGVPIPSAIVTIPARRASTQTNDAGTFRLTITGPAARPDTLHVTRLGYRPRDVAFTATPGQVNVDVLQRSELDAVTPHARLSQSLSECFG